MQNHTKCLEPFSSWTLFLFHDKNLVPHEFAWNHSTRTFENPFEIRPELQSATIEYIASSDYLVYISTFFIQLSCWFTAMLEKNDHEKYFETQREKAANWHCVVLYIHRTQCQFAAFPFVFKKFSPWSLFLSMAVYNVVEIFHSTVNS